MRYIAIALCFAFFVAGCASQGQRGAEIEQRDLFEKTQAKRQQELARQAEAEKEKQAQILREQEELKRQLDEQQRRQQAAQTAGQQQGEQPVIRPLQGSTVGEGQLGAEPWAQLKQPGNVLAKRSIFYDFDRYDIKEEFVPIVEAHAKLLVEHSELKIIVQGNCDDRGSREYNLALGQRRADSVKRAMVLLGVNNRQIETVSFGAEKPVALGQDEVSWAKNRRSDIVYPNEPQ
ncbi:MAG: peptidoglycan-associated lipoprotein Pal [Burkholderiales bacterium]